ncbi:MAG TPA: hypothetical protein VML55_22285, partial [Planctomycetaceae bacterium]|nr:hypothetical protein [Planctomycetaceae bacterium]
GSGTSRSSSGELAMSADLVSSMAFMCRVTQSHHDPMKAGRWQAGISIGFHVPACNLPAFPAG